MKRSNNKRKVLVLFLKTALFLAFGTQLSAQQTSGTMELLEVTNIWNKGGHNAFTDLIRFEDKWLCVFREGSGHASQNGALRIISSADGIAWEPEALIQLTEKNFGDLNLKVLPNKTIFDLRDPKICITPDGCLMLNAAVTYNDRNELQSLAWFSEDGKIWSPPVLIGEHQYWLWRISWHNGIAYGIGRNQYERVPRLYSSANGSDFKVLVQDEAFFPHNPGPNEGTIRFLNNDTAFCLLRLNLMPGAKTDHAHLGLSAPPYMHWEWKDLGMQIGGPNMIQLPDGRIIACVRLYDKKVRTALCWLDLETGTMKEALSLPSGGDSSYAGLVWNDDLLWISYYSSHEGRTSIYLAKVRIDK